MARIYDRKSKSLNDVINQATRLRMLSSGAGNSQRAAKITEIAGRYQKKMEFLAGLDGSERLTPRQIETRRNIRFGRSLYSGIKSQAAGGVG